MPALAQVRQAQTPFEFLRVTRWGGDLFIRGRMEDQQQTSSGIKTSESEVNFEEGTNLWGNGYVYHPNFLQWNALATVGLTQEWLSVNDVDQSSMGTLLGYDVSLLFLQNKPVSFRLFSMLNQSLIQRDFAQDVQVHTMRNGGEVFTKGVFPMSFLLESIAQTEKDDLRHDDRQTQHLRYGIADRRNPDWLTELTVDYQTTRETAEYFSRGGGPQNTQDLPDDNLEADLTNLYRFGGSGAQKSTLSGRVRAVDRKGFYEDRLLSIDELLNLVHTSTFSTYYRLEGLTEETTLQDRRDIIGEMGFLKKVYQSLDIGGHVHLEDEKIDDGTQKNIGAFVDLNYRKKTPIGQYTSTLNLGLQREWQTSPGSERFIEGETVTLTGITFSQLSQPNVVGNITVSNLTRTEVYIEGVDYLVDELGSFTRISRVATGAILDPQAVLVDYNVKTSPDATFDTTFLAWSNRLQLKHIPVALYGNYRLQDDNLVSGTDPGSLDHRRDWLLGAELVYKKLTVAVEHEVRDQQLSPPSVADRVRVGYLHSFDRVLDLSADLHAEHLQYQKATQFGLAEGDDVLNTYGGDAQVVMKLRKNLLLRFRSDYLQTTGRDETALWRNTLGLEWSYGKLDLSVEGRHNIFQQEKTDGTSSALMFYVKRRF